MGNRGFFQGQHGCCMFCMHLGATRRGHPGKAKAPAASGSTPCSRHRKAYRLHRAHLRVSSTKDPAQDRNSVTEQAMSVKSTGEGAGRPHWDPGPLVRSLSGQQSREPGRGGDSRSRRGRDTNGGGAGRAAGTGPSEHCPHGHHTAHQHPGGPVRPQAPPMSTSPPFTLPTPLPCPRGPILLQDRSR